MGFLESFSERHFFFFHLAYYNQDEIFIPLKNFLVLLLGFFQVSDFEKPRRKAKKILETKGVCRHVVLTTLVVVKWPAAF